MKIEQFNKSREKKKLNRTKTFNKSIMRMMQQFRQKLPKWNSRTHRKTMMKMLNLVKPKPQIMTQMRIRSNLMKTKKD
jgi:hypothetical protein